MLHLTKVAFGCHSLDYLAERLAIRAAAGGIRLTTRYRPKRHAEIIGGSLFWIIKHRLVARSEITAFEDNPEGKIDILLGPKLVTVRAMPRRAHQGWRYLEDKDAPRDLFTGDAELDAMPPELLGELAAMGLI